MGEGVLGNVQGGHAAQCMTVSKMYKTSSATLRLSFRSSQHPTSPGHAVNKRLAPGRQAATATRIQDTGAFVHMFVHQPEGWAAAEWNIPDIVAGLGRPKNNDLTSGKRHTDKKCVSITAAHSFKIRRPARSTGTELCGKIMHCELDDRSHMLRCQRRS